MNAFEIRRAPDPGDRKVSDIVFLYLEASYSIKENRYGVYQKENGLVYVRYEDNVLSCRIMLEILETARNDKNILRVIYDQDAKLLIAAQAMADEI